MIGDRQLSSVAIAVCLLPLLLLRITDEVSVPGLGPLFRITNHGGAALGSAAVLGLCFSSTRPRYVLMGGISFLTGVSDPLFAASCAAPLLVLGLIASVERAWGVVIVRADVHRVALRNRFLLTAVTGLGGAALTSQVHQRTNQLPVVLAKTSDSVWQGLWHDFVLAQPGQAGWLLCIVALSGATVVMNRWRSGATKLRVLALWQVGSVVATLAAMIWTRNYLDSGSLRYLTVPFALGPVVLGALVTGPLTDARAFGVRERAIVGSTGAVITMLCGAMVICLPALAQGQFRSQWRRKAQCVAAVMQREQVDAVLTDYWRCKPLRLFSDGRIGALQMRAKLKRPYFWISSRSWYRGDHKLGVIATNELRAESIVQQYGPPAQVDHCEDIELFSYRGAARDKLNAKVRRMIVGFLSDPKPP